MPRFNFFNTTTYQGDVFVNVLNPRRTDRETVRKRLCGFETKENTNATLIPKKVPGQTTYSDYNWKGSPGILFESKWVFFLYYNQTDIGSDGMDWRNDPQKSDMENDLTRMTKWANQMDPNDLKSNRHKLTLESSINKIHEIHQIRKEEKIDLYATKYNDAGGRQIITRKKGKFSGSAYDRNVGNSSTDIRYNECHIKSHIEAVKGATINLEDIDNINRRWGKNTRRIGAITICAALKLHYELDQIRQETVNDDNKLDEIAKFHETCCGRIDQKIIFLEKLKTSNEPELRDAFMRKKKKNRDFDTDDDNNKTQWKQRNMEKCVKYIEQLQKEKETHQSLCKREEVKKLLKEKMGFYIRNKNTGKITKVSDRYITNLKKNSENILKDQYTDTDFLEELILNGFSAAEIESYFFLKFKNRTECIDATVNEKNSNGETPIVLAAKKGYSDVVEALLTHEADVNKADQFGNTPLMIAAENGHSGIVQTLLTHGADVNKADQFGNTPLMIAAAKGDLDMVKALLVGHDGIDVNKADQSGNTPLMIATENGHSGIVQTLLTHGADVNKALMIAAAKGDLDMVKALLVGHDGIDLDKADQSGNTPLMIAAAKGDLDVVEVLLGHEGIDLDKADRLGNTPLMIAAAKGDLDMVKALLVGHEGIDLDKADRLGNTPLMIAAKKGDLDMVKALLTHGADVNQADKCGDAPLMIAAAKGDLDMVKALLTHGADVNQADEFGNTPLMIATENGHSGIVKALSEHKDSVNPAFLGCCKGMLGRPEAELVLGGRKTGHVRE